MVDAEEAVEDMAVDVVEEGVVDMAAEVPVRTLTAWAAEVAEVAVHGGNML